MQPQNIYSYIKEQENAFETEEIQVGENWFWNFKNHVQLIFHLKNGIFFTGENNWLRAFKNIMEPMLNLSYWTEDIEVKDITFYIENAKGKILSFILKKYHDEVYTKEHDIDTLIDEITESDIDYGGVLVQRGKKRPEILPLNAVAFCDQTDILGGAIGFKHNFSVSKLKSMSKLGWGEEKNGADITLDELCTLATLEQDAIGTVSTKQNNVPSKKIEVYIVRGSLPESYLNEDGDPEYSVPQIQVVAFYTKKDNTKEGVTLYKKEDDGESLKFFTSKKVYQRALGRGVGETLVPSQVWTNWLTIHKNNLLEAGAKVPLYTDDPAYSTRNKIQDMENLEITTIEEGKRIYQVPTASPASIQLIERSVDDWLNHAQLGSSAFDPILGMEASSGTTFRGQERVVAQGKGLHDRRRGQRAKFIEEIYRDWIIPDMVKEINRGKKFLSTLSTEELLWLADRISQNKASEKIKDKILNLRVEDVSPEKLQALRELPNVLREDFIKTGNKQLLEALKDEFEDIEVKIGINVANKQKNLANLSDKILSIFQFVFANPQGFQQAMQIPALAKSFEDILEFGGLSIGDFASLTKAQVSPMQVQPQQAPQELLPQAPTEA
jgi:hypothetical protein